MKYVVYNFEELLFENLCQNCIKLLFKPCIPIDQCEPLCFELCYCMLDPHCCVFGVCPQDPHPEEDSNVQAKAKPTSTKVSNAHPLGHQYNITTAHP